MNSLYKESDVTYWSQRLKQVWGLWKKGDHLVIALQEFFNSVHNPFLSVLHVMKNCSDFKHTKPNSLPYTIMEEFEKWVESRSDVGSILTSDIKIEAFSIVVTQRNMALVKLVCNAYKMKEEKLLFLDSVRDLIERKQYKEACQIASQLQLHDHFGIEEFLVPLVFQDKLTIVEEFLSESSDHQRKLVIFLDSLLVKRNIGSEINALVYKLGIPETKAGKLYYKPLSKLVARLTNIYKLPPDLCPNLNRKRSEGALQFLMYKKYHEHSIGHVSWREMVREAVSSNVDLQQQVVSLVHSFGDFQEAVYWAKEFYIPPSKCPFRIQRMLESGYTEHSHVPSASEENLDDASRENFHTLSLPDSSIVLVDNERVYEEFVKELSDVHIVGIDSEWKPYFGTRRNELALIQVAMKHKVYIFDIVVLKTTNENVWKSARAKLFGNDKIVKLGFGISSDLNVISQSLPYLADIFRDKCGYLDLISVWKKLTRDFGFVFPYGGDTSGESLARLVELCLGKKLDKLDQFSNWEQRPLRRSQIRYAALDAFCLLEVYDVLKENAIKQDIPFDEVCAGLVSKTKSPKRLNKVKKIPEIEPVEMAPPCTNPITVASFRVLCDRGLEGLGQQLRKLGVDTLLIPPMEHPDNLARHATKEGRVVITRGHTNYNRLIQFVPLGYCFMVSSENVSDQLREVLRHFNVIVRRSDVFSRCKLCNGASFAKVSQKTMMKLMKLKGPAPVQEKHPKWTYGKYDTKYKSGFEDKMNKVSTLENVDSVWVENIDVHHGQTRQGAVIQMNVPSDCLHKITEFNICEHCGRVYWDGSHFERFTNGKLKDIFSE